MKLEGTMVSKTGLTQESRFCLLGGEGGAEEQNGNQEFWDRRRRRCGGKGKERDMGGGGGDVNCTFILRTIHLYVSYKEFKNKQTNKKVLLGIRDSGWPL